MGKYKRVKGGEKNELSGVPFRKEELEQICDLYIELGGRGIHENNPKIHVLAQKLGRTIRSVENQLLGFKAVDTNKVGRQHFNTRIKEVWEERQSELKTRKEEKRTEKESRKAQAGEEIKFRISSQLKNIIGRELITDDYIAVFELVKNSYDAHATHVKVIFEDDKIIIWDDGKGMNKNDLIEKWLFVAYSAKKQGVEDKELESEEFKSYRDRIRPKASYAGAKGIGRFSSDRLGSRLKLITRKIGDSNYEQLEFDWDEFEDEPTEEFADMVIEHTTIKQTPYKGFGHGVILEISGLRDRWPRPKKRDLKWSLEKLINPFDSLGNNKRDSFSIEVISDKDKAEDEKETIPRNTVNGPVKNFIFETLNIKTTQILSWVDEEGSSITTELIDRGVSIYKIKEPNLYRYLANTQIQLFYLNTAAKRNFTILMSVEPKNFGSVFLFNNGFRVFPIGEPNNDPFGIDLRKSQGQRRYLGSRDVLGRVELWGTSDYFQETSSRDGGLIATPATKQLEGYFIDTLKKLERYVVTIQWPIKDQEEDLSKLSNVDSKAKIIELVAKLANSKDVELLSYSKDFLNIVQEKTENAPPAVFDNLMKLAEGTGDSSYLDEIESGKLAYLRLKKEKEEEERKRADAEEKAKEEERKRKEAEEKAREAEERANKAEDEKQQRVRQVKFLQSVQTLDISEVQNLHHQISNDANAIDARVKSFKLQLDKFGQVSKEEIKSFLDDITFAYKKILAVTRFTTKENFLSATRTTKDDIIGFIRNYLDNIYKHHFDNKVKLNFETAPGATFVTEFKPIELTIIVDNLISNSRKKNAHNAFFQFLPSGNSLTLLYRDDGDGLDKTIHEPSLIFEKGFTTTRGSGLGLYHVKEIMKDEFKGTIEVDPNLKKGVEFKLIFNRR